MTVSGTPGWHGLSVILITKNEARDLPACLASVAWADEIIVVDSGSTDATLEIARTYGARLQITQDWPGFGPQKNRALALARYPWVLSLDADEQVSPALRAAIEAAIQRGTHTAYSVPRRSFFCGVAVKYSGWWPDRVTRLFQAGSARFSDALVHERLETTGPVGTIDVPLLHYTYQDLDEFHLKQVQYSQAGARMLLARGKRPGLGAAIGHGVWAFIRTYVFKQGWRDGRVGLLIAIGNAEASFYKYAKAAFGVETLPIETAPLDHTAASESPIKDNPPF